MDPSSRQLAHALLILGKRPYPPTREEIAELLGVDVRTVDGRLKLLRDSGFLVLGKAGRRNLYRLRNPAGSLIACDQRSHAISDHMRSAITCDQVSDLSVKPSLSRQDEPEGDLSPKSIPDRDSVVGGGSDSSEKDSPTTNPPRRKISTDELTTATGRWLLREGFNIAVAVELQHLPLKACQEDYHRRRHMGQQHGAIVTAWRVEPPAGESSSAPAGAGPFRPEDFERLRRELGYEEDSQ